MNQRIGKITLLSNDKDSGNEITISDYAFNQMTMEEQDIYMQTRMVFDVCSQGAGVGSKMLKEMKDMTKQFEDKYNPRKPETLSEMKRRLLKPPTK